MRDLLKELIGSTRHQTANQLDQELKYCELSEAAADEWMSFDDIEFSLPEALSADELAQCLVELTRSYSTQHQIHGETEHYRLHYDERHPGRIVLEYKNMISSSGRRLSSITQNTAPCAG